MHLHNASQHRWELHYRQGRLKEKKKKKEKESHICTRKDPVLQCSVQLPDCFTSQSGTATIVDKTTFTTGHGLSMFYFVPYSKHIAPKIQSSHRVDFILCLLIWTYGGIGQKAHIVNTETVKNKMKRQSKSLMIMREQTPMLATF